MVNEYSQTWFELFLETQPYTEAEVAFLMRHLPNPPFGRILDVACGQGRHARILAGEGYEIVGIDLNEQALAIARSTTAGTAIYLCHDMRRVEEVPGVFDAVLSLWQSFGYFDEATNRDVLRQCAVKLRPGGRLVLDIYHRGYFERSAGVRHLERRGVTVAINETMRGNRLTAQLDYGDGRGQDTFEWQLYAPDEICREAAAFGLQPLLTCTEANEERAAGPEKPRMQIVFERQSR